MRRSIFVSDYRPRVRPSSMRKLSSDTYSARTPVIVSVVINGQSTPWDIRQTGTRLSHTHTFTIPVEVAQNYRINFQTVVNLSRSY